MPGLYLTPVLMLTAKGGEAIIDEAMGAPANDKLVKPVEPEHFVRRDDEVLKNNLFHRAT